VAIDYEALIKDFGTVVLMNCWRDLNDYRCPCPPISPVVVSSSHTEMSNDPTEKQGNYFICIMGFGSKLQV
jgi:hypothetical protein